MPKRIQNSAPLGRHFIREWRDHLNLTQAQVAAALNMSEANYSRIENGVTPYTQRTLEALANFFGLPNPAFLLSPPPRRRTALIG